MKLTNLRGMFPVLRKTINGQHLIYFDTAASAQKPLLVTDAMKEFDEKSYSNVHRGIHTLAEEATEKFEEARSKVAQFIRASPEETIFTSGTTDSINRIADMIPFEKGDEIVVTMMEHHSNFVPWQQLAKRHDLTFKVIPLTHDFRLDMEKAKQLITDKTKVLAITHVSNVLGTINPIKELATIAHKHNALIVVDGAQAIPHMRVDVKELNVDFYAFSSHKMYGPTGCGILYGKRTHLESFSPRKYGGEMVKDVKVEETSWNDLPWKFEPGTPNITQAIGLGFAVDFMQSIGYDAVSNHEHKLLEHALKTLKGVEGLAIIGPQNAKDRSGAISFTFEGVHPHDVAAVLDEQGIAVRAGHHCAQPLHCALGLDATTRVSLGVYNTIEEIDKLPEALEKVRRRFT